MFIRTQENYRKVFKSIVGLKPDLRIFVLTLFNILVGTYLERERFAFKKFRLAEFCSKPIKTKIKITLYTHKNPGKL